jgi:hypothetical protein
LVIVARFTAVAPFEQKKPVLQSVQNGLRGRFFLAFIAQHEATSNALPTSPEAARRTVRTTNKRRRPHDDLWRNDSHRRRNDGRRNECRSWRAKWTRKWPSERAFKRATIEPNRLGAGFDAGRKRNQRGNKKEAIHGKPH